MLVCVRLNVVGPEDPVDPLPSALLDVDPIVKIDVPEIRAWGVQKQKKTRKKSVSRSARVRA